MTQFVYRGLSNQAVAELDGTGAVVRSYAWDSKGRQLYTKIGPSVYYEITNLHGDVVALATTTALAGTVHFDPWGIRLGAAGTTIPFGFQGSAGSWTDATTSFVSMGARWYYPKDSLFLSSDPAAGTANSRTPMAGLRWLYALDNPLAYSDPSGLRIIIDDGGDYTVSAKPSGSTSYTPPATYSPPAEPAPPAPCDFWCRMRNGWNAATQIVNIRPDPGGVQDNLIALGNHMDSGWKQRYRDTLASSADWVNGTRSDLVSGDPYRIARGTAGVVVFSANFVPVGRAATLAKDAGEIAISQAVEHAPQIERVVSGAVTQGERFLAPKVERFLGDAKNGAVDFAESCVLRPNSFAAGTLVLMADGTMKPIEQVRVGDLVMTSDPQQGIQQPEPVTDVIVGQGLKHLYDIQVDGEVIEATYNHPFWVVELQTFVWAQDLVPGEHLLLADGRAPPIQSISHHDEITTVYNLSVARVHTFFVGPHPVLVHNSCGLEDAAFGGLSRAEEFGLQGYQKLRGALQDTGLQAHHLIEKRFANVFDQSPGQMLSMAVTKAEHQVFTNAWRKAIPYGPGGTAIATRAQVEQGARQIYAQYPSILKALGF